jgi:DNA helicase II / ATP-dependent DNA helicase PcrA
MASDDATPEPAVAFSESTASALRALAGPGTGKTYALIRRLAHLLEEGAEPGKILVVTFARTAARDLVTAVAQLEAAGDELIPRTLHSWCFGLLGRTRVLQATARVPRILLEFEKDLVLADLSDDFGGIRDRRSLVSAFEASWARRQIDEPGQPVPGLDQTFQDALLGSLRWHKAMLVGEVVPIALSYLRNNPQASERRAYDHVLVDEYQDLNRAEQEVLNLLSAESNLAVIGDDDQSIYAFKWANPEGIREFHTEHPGTEDVQFVVCRRCPQQVVDMAQTLIQRNPGRVRLPLVAKEGNPAGEIHNVQWRSVGDEARGVADFIAHKIAQRAIQAGRCLVLVNSRKIGFAIRDAIRERNIACSSFFREEPVDSDSAREALTLLTLLADPHDRVALRAWLAFGSSTERRPAYRRLLAAAQTADTDVREILDQLDRGGLTIPYTGNAVDRYRELGARVADLTAVANEGLGQLIDVLLPEGNDELALLRATALTVLPEVEDLSGLMNALRYGVAQRETPLESTEVRVMSMHASKGLTADLVVLAGLVEGVMPHVDRDAAQGDQEHQEQEQRRLFFVGITRTTNVLMFSSYSQLDAATAHRLQVAGGRQYGNVVETFASSFFDELGDGLPDPIRGEDWEYL